MLGDRFYQCFTRLKRHSRSTRSAAMAPRSAIAAASSSCSSSAFLFKNYNSLYDPASDSEATTLTLPLSSPRAAGGSSFSSSGDCPDEAAAGGGGSCPSERELSTAIASHRLLLATPGKSNSIVDSAVVAVGVGVGSGVAVPTFSPDPYWEFRRSMEEMVAALKLDARKHRAHLHELLLCYLALNRKHAHKYIVGAFTDLLLGLTAAAGADE